MIRHLRNAFISGLILLLPLSVTVFVVNIMLAKIGNPASKLFFWYLDPTIRGMPIVQILLSIISIVVVLIIIAGIGFLSNYFFGKLIVRLTEKILTSVPFVKTVYSTAKQIVDTFSSQKKAVFQKVVMLEYPRKGLYSLGFLTGESKGETQEKTGRTIINVFIPTTPNPTSGYLILVPKDDVTELEMGVADGMKLIISGGAVIPKYKSAKPLPIETETKDRESQ